MKQFIAKCFALPVVGDAEDWEGYKVGRLYLFNVTDALPLGNTACSTIGDDGTSHTMDADYFSKYFTRIHG